MTYRQMTKVGLSFRFTFSEAIQSETNAVGGGGVSSVSFPHTVQVSIVKGCILPSTLAEKSIVMK